MSEKLENQVFYPPTEITENANAKKDIYEQAEKDRLGFWDAHAKELVTWFEPYDKVLDDSNPPFYKWFTNGKLNVSYNCVDRHAKSNRRNKAAIMYESEIGRQVCLTYGMLYHEVNKFANALASVGVEKGDRVCLYMPMIPEAVVAMLACARIGAPHSLVFGGFSPESLRDRINDCEAKVVITADGNFRRGNPFPLKQNADKALEDTPSIQKCIVVKNAGNEVEWNDRDVWYHDLMADAGNFYEPEVMDAEDLLFILYTSGTTGKPKGVVHSSGGYLVQTQATTKYVFDLKEDDVYWCTADIGWITGHSYVVYGPLALGATVFMYDGTINYPDKDRMWDMAERYGVTKFYTAPTAIRTFMKWGNEFIDKHDLSNIKILGTVGEPINPEAWKWYQEKIGGGTAPIMDTWWQTETGAHMITPLPGVTPLKPGTATNPFPGIEVDVVDENGESTNEGYLVVKSPWPSMLRTIYGDDERYVDTYWKKFNNKFYFAGDGAKRDEMGYIWVTGRVDDVLNVSGHRLGTAEIESALVECEEVAEAAAIGKKHDVKGEAVVAFVILKEGFEGTDEVVDKLRKHVGVKIGPIARPDDIIFTAELPKTRSGKIMRRLLRDIAEGRAIGNTTTLSDPSVMKDIASKYGSKEE